MSDEQVADIERYLAGVYDSASCISVRSGIYLRHVKALLRALKAARARATRAERHRDLAVELLGECDLLNEEYYQRLKRLEEETD